MSRRAARARAKRNARAVRSARAGRSSRQRAEATPAPSSQRRRFAPQGDLSWRNPSLSIDPVLARVQAAGVNGRFLASRAWRPRRPRRPVPGWVFLLLAVGFLLVVYLSVSAR